MAANRKDIRTAEKGVSLEHRHFAFIAATLKACKPTPGMYEGAGPAREQWLDMVNQFATECRATNLRFNRARFLAACDVEV